MSLAGEKNNKKKEVENSWKCDPSSDTGAATVAEDRGWVLLSLLAFAGRGSRQPPNALTALGTGQGTGQGHSRAWWLLHGPGFSPRASVRDSAHTLVQRKGEEVCFSPRMLSEKYLEFSVSVLIKGFPFLAAAS